MNPERETPSAWARRVDLQWIEENFAVLQQAVRKVFDQMGRGAVAVDVTAPPMAGGHPFTYWPQDYLEAHVDDGVKRLVETYLPREELIVLLLKSNREIHAYRVGPASF